MYFIEKKKCKLLFRLDANETDISQVFITNSNDTEIVLSENKTSSIIETKIILNNNQTLINVIETISNDNNQSTIEIIDKNHSSQTIIDMFLDILQKANLSSTISIIQNDTQLTELVVPEEISSTTIKLTEP